MSRDLRKVLELLGDPQVARACCRRRSVAGAAAGRGPTGAPGGDSGLMGGPGEEDRLFFARGDHLLVEAGIGDRDGRAAGKHRRKRELAAGAARTVRRPIGVDRAEPLALEDEGDAEKGVGALRRERRGDTGIGPPCDASFAAPFQIVVSFHTASGWSSGATVTMWPSSPDRIPLSRARPRECPNHPHAAEVEREERRPARSEERLLWIQAVEGRGQVAEGGEVLIELLSLGEDGAPLTIEDAGAQDGEHRSGPDPRSARRRRVVRPQPRRDEHRTGRGR